VPSLIPCATRASSISPAYYGTDRIDAAVLPPCAQAFDGVTDALGIADLRAAPLGIRRQYVAYPRFSGITRAGGESALLVFVVREPACEDLMSFSAAACAR
jgi:hypothetical protein